MHVLIVDKTAGLDSSHERHQAIASQPDISLTVLGPRVWIENGQTILWRPRVDCRYTPVTGHVLGKGFYARVMYLNGLCRALMHRRPDIIQLLEEPWSFTAAQVMLYAGLLAPEARLFFYTWENINRGWNYPSRGAPLYRAVEKATHQSSSGAICATRGAKSVLRAKGYTHPSVVIPYGIPRSFMEGAGLRSTTSQPFTIGFVGRLLHMKGADRIIQALPSLENTYLRIIGEGEERANLEQLANRLQVSDRIEWVGAVEEHQVRSHIAGLDALVVPSRTTPGWMEQLGRVAIEAMAVGVPVIASQSGALPEVVGSAGLLFPEESRDELIHCIQTVRKDPDLRRHLSEQGIKRARERFSWTRFASEIHQFWQHTPRS